MRAGNITPDLTTLWKHNRTFLYICTFKKHFRNHLAVIYTHVCFLQWRELRWKVTSGSNWRINCSVNFRLPIAEHKWFYTTHYNFLGAPALPRCRPSLNELLIMSRINERAWLELMRRSRRAAGQTRTGDVCFLFLLRFRHQRHRPEHFSARLHQNTHWAFIIRSDAVWISLSLRRCLRRPRSLPSVAVWFVDMIGGSDSVGVNNVNTGVRRGRLGDINTGFLACGKQLKSWSCADVCEVTCCQLSFLSGAASKHDVTWGSASVSLCAQCTFSRVIRPKVCRIKSQHSLNVRRR